MTNKGHCSLRGDECHFGSAALTWQLAASCGHKDPQWSTTKGNPWQNYSLTKLCQSQCCTGTIRDSQPKHLQRMASCYHDGQIRVSAWSGWGGHGSCMPGGTRWSAKMHWVATDSDKTCHVLGDVSCGAGWCLQLWVATPRKGPHGCSHV